MNALRRSAAIVGSLMLLIMVSPVAYGQTVDSVVLGAPEQACVYLQAQVNAIPELGVTLPNECEKFKYEYEDDSVTIHVQRYERYDLGDSLESGVDVVFGFSVDGAPQVMGVYHWYLTAASDGTEYERSKAWVNKGYLETGYSDSVKGWSIIYRDISDKDGFVIKSVFIQLWESINKGLERRK